MSQSSATARVFTLFFALLAAAAQLDFVKADAGDVIAGMIGAVMSLVAICALLGWWSRRGQSGSEAGSVESGEAH